LVRSLPGGDLLLQTEYKCTIIQIVTHYNVFFKEEFLVVVLFELHSFGLQVVLWNDSSILPNHCCLVKPWIDFWVAFLTCF